MLRSLHIISLFGIYTYTIDFADSQGKGLKFITSPIPYVGPIVAYASTALSCLIAGDVRTFALAVVVLAVIQFVDGQIVNPKILADSVEVHPILVIVALIVGGKVGGVVGMLVAVPCAALAKIYFEKYVAWRDSRN